jgi:hypothetical protein
MAASKVRLPDPMQEMRIDSASPSLTIDPRPYKRSIWLSTPSNAACLAGSIGGDGFVEFGALLPLPLFRFDDAALASRAAEGGDDLVCVSTNEATGGLAKSPSKMEKRLTMVMIAGGVLDLSWCQVGSRFEVPGVSW